MSNTEKQLTEHQSQVIEKKSSIPWVVAARFNKATRKEAEGEKVITRKKQVKQIRPFLL